MKQASMTEHAADPSVVHVGIDVGSTTTKAVALDPRDGTVLYSSYRRHGARQAESVSRQLDDLLRRFPYSRMRGALCGSGARPIAEALGLPYIQEVVANALALQRLYPTARTAIELGGQDAKVIFFRPDEATGAPTVADMRMNGTCAGGTGALVDEIATLLRVPVEGFDALAERATALYDISGRCGVYAKTDIQPLLNQGVPKEDIAWSLFHAIAKQTIGGLAQGADIVAPVVFEGGPLTFNPRLVDAFAERLGLREEDILRPEHPETIMAYGTALSLSGMFADTPAFVDTDNAEGLLGDLHETATAEGYRPLFANDAERAAFEERHRLPAPAPRGQLPAVLPVHLGIDSGSTTTKFALIDEDENLVDEFYAPNEGEPLEIARRALVAMRDDYRARGTELKVLSVGTTGYGELLFAKALHADCHVVETVAHAQAATKYVPDVTFILDIGGQDMKAIWIDDGVITDIVVNEACSSGCGSFLENFASTLDIPVEGIADAAFRSARPAELGSRCTVFMNSSIVTEQRNGKSPEDIMAGLCRSIIENVFTKVIRVSNLDSLGDRIVVQGGTFRNDAVLRALEEHLGRDVWRAPYPGIMGALGCALLAKRRFEQAGRPESSFVGFDALEDFSYEQASNVRCPFCANHCARTLVTFSDGSVFVTGNRCARGEVVGDPKDAAVMRQVRKKAEGRRTTNLFEVRERLLFEERPVTPVRPDNGVTVGIPRALEFWDAMPFWSSFFRSLGFRVLVSKKSTRELYEDGLPGVASDTVCFPAKLVHGHVRDLAARGVDRIFMPTITAVPSENPADTSESMCAVLKGYPIVMRNSDDPSRHFGIPFDDPLFHWHTEKDREAQLSRWMQETFGIPRADVRAAIEQGDAAQEAFRTELERAGEQALFEAEESGGFAVVLAGRPYHNDALVNHDLPRMFAERGIAVLSADAVPGVRDVDLSLSRLDIVNNYHARMLASAVIAAGNPHLEYVQIVSFGCGHDAYLSDEIVRLMKEVSGKTPLILKVDESDIAGPLRIRVNSFVETVNMRRETTAPRPARALSDPYPVKFRPEDRTQRTILVPNTSHAFARLMAAAFSKQGVKAVPLPIGREEATRLGKKYVHNDICFPAQMTIGEALAELGTGRYDLDRVAIGTGKYIGDCRLTHYSALLRKALDDAGYAQVPIITNDDVDFHDMHPGFKMNIATAVRIAMTLPMIDVLEELLRKMRPYELERGAADAAFERALDLVMEGLERHGVRGATKGFEEAIDVMAQVPYDRSDPKPQVLIVGEYLLNFHPGANHDIEAYLEENGLEVIEARMTDVIRKTYFYQHAQEKEYHVDRPLPERTWHAVADRAFDVAHDNCDRIAVRHPLYEPACRMEDLVKESDPIIHHTFDAGEGVLIPGEILHHAAHGCQNFIILQPFGCLPNHVVGRGIVKKLKELHPDVQILSLDYDPDVSFANIENRLQMLVMNARAQHAARPDGTADVVRPRTDDGRACREALRQTEDADAAGARREGERPSGRQIAGRR